MSAKMSANIALVEWVKINHPDLYAKTLIKMAENPEGLGVPWAGSSTYGVRPSVTTVKQSLPATSKWADRFSGFMGSIAPQLIKLKQQRDIMKMQMKRARNGLPPANVADYSPVIRTSIDIGKDTRAAMASEAKKGLSKLIVPAAVAGVGLVGILFFVGRKK